ncbi:MAG: hypothetical protein JW902_17660 [Syntrophaceae bacterium]|nr:hypothetical protein [Syntrophaceae bacterium]
MKKKKRTLLTPSEMRKGKSMIRQIASSLAKAMENLPATSGIKSPLKDYQENPLTFDDVLKLLEVEELPFMDTLELKAFAATSAASLLKRYSPEWFKENRVRLIQELELISQEL